MTVLGTVAAVRAGKVREYSWSGSVVRSGALKEEVLGPIGLTKLGLVGDEQADLVNHGGPDKAVLCYSAHHYPRWRDTVGLELPCGAFFENLTLAAPGHDERTIVMGERWRIGEAIVEVSQPRSPCYKLAKRWGVKDLVLTVQRTGWTGWYLRVVEEGRVCVGDPILILERPDAATLSEVSAVVQGSNLDLELVCRVLAAPGLPERWRTKIQARLAGERIDDAGRMSGPPLPDA